MKKLFLFIFFLFSFFTIKAQQEAQYSQYMFNSLVINPAYAGYKEAMNISVLHRDQWTSIEGAPKTQSIVLDGAFFNEKKVGLGLAVVNDKTGLQNQASAYINYAYRLPVGANDSRLSFGVALGVAQYVLNGQDAVLDDLSDPNFNGEKQTYFTPDAKFGIFYSNEKFYAGISATNLLSKSINYQQVGNNTIVRQRKHYFLTAGALVDLNSFMKFKPSFLIREDTKGATNIDINSFLLLKETLWLGASYRTSTMLGKKTPVNAGNGFKQNALVGTVEVYMFQNLRLGYAYDHSLSALRNSAGGTHEISLGLILNFANRSAVLLTPRYF